MGCSHPGLGGAEGMFDRLGKLVFPYGVGFDYDIVNKPPVAEPPLEYTKDAARTGTMVKSAMSSSKRSASTAL